MWYNTYVAYCTVVVMESQVMSRLRWVGWTGTRTTVVYCLMILGRVTEGALTSLNIIPGDN